MQSPKQISDFVAAATAAAGNGKRDSRLPRATTYLARLLNLWENPLVEQRRIVNI
jgi:hypothetical protein